MVVAVIEDDEKLLFVVGNSGLFPIGNAVVLDPPPVPPKLVVGNCAPPNPPVEAENEGIFAPPTAAEKGEELAHPLLPGEVKDVGVFPAVKVLNCAGDPPNEGANDPLLVAPGA